MYYHVLFWMVNSIDNAAHNSSVCQVGFFQRQMLSVRRSLMSEATRALVQAFVSCRLDYCNSLLAGVADIHVQHLQYIQNAAARVVSGTWLAVTTTSHRFLLHDTGDLFTSELFSTLRCLCRSVYMV